MIGKTLIVACCMAAYPPVAHFDPTSVCSGAKTDDEVATCVIESVENGTEFNYFLPKKFESLTKPTVCNGSDSRTFLSVDYKQQKVTADNKGLRMPPYSVTLHHLPASVSAGGTVGSCVPKLYIADPTKSCPTTGELALYPGSLSDEASNTWDFVLQSPPAAADPDANDALKLLIADADCQPDEAYLVYGIGNYAAGSTAAIVVSLATGLSLAML